MKKYIPLATIIAVSLVLISIWFKSKTGMASAEEGLVFFYPLRAARVFSSLVYSGLGNVNPIYLPRTTFFWLVALMQTVLPAWLTQALVFLILIITGMSGVYLIVRKFLGKDVFTSLCSGIFYGANLYVMGQVWYRFILSGIVAWAYFPLFILLFLSWVSSGKASLLVLLLLTSPIFSITFGQPAFIFAFSAPIIVIVATEVYKKRKTPKALYSFIRRIVLASLLFVFVNIWWIFPYLKLGSSSLESVSNSDLNFESLRGVSGSFPISQILLLRQKFYFDPKVNPNPFWGDIFVTPAFYFISILTFLITFWGWLKGRTNKWWLYFTVLAVVGLFVSKGTNKPFGFVFYENLFRLLPAFGALRNSYEKFGIVWLLPYSIFFGLGVEWVVKKARSSFGKLLLAGILLFIICGVQVWPMWTGYVFPEYYLVSVPDYYQQANRLLNLDQSDGRILSLPMVRDEGVRYTWGYIGIEPSEFLFDKSTISKTLFSKYNDIGYRQIYNSLSETKEYDRYLDLANVQYLILHNEIDTEFSLASPSAKIKAIIESNPKVTLVGQAGELIIYQYSGKNNSQLIIAEGDNPPVVSYIKVSSREYSVEVEGADAPYDLILKNSYNSNWKAEIGGEELGGHFVAFNYANGWDINKVGDYRIRLKFVVWPWEKSS